MSPLPSRVLRPSLPRTAGLLVLSSAFTAGGAWMVAAGEAIGWLVVVPFGLGVLVFTASLLPNASYLRVDPDGFTMCSLFRAHSYRWSDVRGFSVGRVGANNMVVFDFSDEFPDAPRLRKVSTALAGHEAALPDSYGMPLEELARLMNEYRDRAVASRPAQASDAAGPSGGRDDGWEQASDGDLRSV